MQNLHLIFFVGVVNARDKSGLAKRLVGKGEGFEAIPKSVHGNARTRHIVGCQAKKRNNILCKTIIYMLFKYLKSHGRQAGERVISTTFQKIFQILKCPAQPHWR
jgi:hypothetical protein